MNNTDVKELCLKLLNSDKEEEIISILKEYNYWDDDKFWRMYGDKENNFSIINNQASRSDAAIVEKLINSIDARLLNECLVNGINQESNEAPKTIREAVARFFDENPKTSYAGIISNWTNSKRTEVARGITLTATGAKPGSGNASYTISDSGEGQTPDNMPFTFLSLAESNKLRTPFVQGKFNQGGTGVLKFCGEMNFQLIITKRNPILVGKECSEDDTKWGFTIVRREPPSEGRLHSIYTYLAPINAEANYRKGDVLRFEANELPIFPEGNEPYVRKASWGTLIKLYEYHSEGFRSNILMKSGLLSHLDLLLTNPALPIRLHECRTYGGKKGSYDTNLSGIQVRLEDDKRDNLEFETSFSMNIKDELLKGNIYAFKKDKDKTYRRSEGILFSINGQTHDIWTTDFFRRKAIGLSYIYNSILVIVDCSYLTHRTREDLFPSSRDRMSKNDFRKLIEEELELELKNNQLIRDLKERRRNEYIHSKLENEKPLEDTLKSIFKKNPTLSKLFIDGERISNPFKTTGAKSEEKEYIGEKHPSYFKFKGKDYGFEMRRDVNMDQRFRITFESDVENGYFNREIDYGIRELFIEIGGELQNYKYNNTMNLQNGIAVLNVKLPDNVNVGEKYKFLSRVYDKTLIEPFDNYFEVTVKEKAQISKGRGDRRKPPSNKNGNDREVSSKIAFPNIEEVYESNWGSYDPPFDKYTSLRIKYVDKDESSNKDIYDFFINMDNIYLNNELKNNTDKKDIIKTQFKISMVIIGLSIIQYYENINGNKLKEEQYKDTDEEDNNIEDKVEIITKALAPTILPLIDSVGSIDSDETQSIDFTGEDY